MSRRPLAPTGGLAVLVAALVAIVGCGSKTGPNSTPSTASSLLPSPGSATWVTSWGAAMSGVVAAGDFSPGGDAALPGNQATHQTFRTIAHLTGGGQFVRVRLSNAYGSGPITFGSVTVALRQSGPSLVPGSLRTVTFGRRSTVTVAPQARAVSDPVPIAVSSGQDLAVSLYVPGPTGPITWHISQPTSSYYSAAGSGDFSTDASGAALHNENTAVFWLAGLDVSSAPAQQTAAVVALGDSITDGARLMPDQNARWTDRLAERLQRLPADQRQTVVNEGIDANELTGPGLSRPSPSGLTRFASDVVALAGVRTVVLEEGLNDAATGVSPQTIESAMRALASRAHAARLRILVATLTPVGGAVGLAQSLVQSTNQTTAAVNHWIKSSHLFDGVVDFDAILRDPSDPSRLNPALDSGDHVHPNAAGTAAMAARFPLPLLLGG